MKTLRWVRAIDAAARRVGLWAIPPYPLLCRAQEAWWSIAPVRRHRIAGLREKLPAHPFLAGGRAGEAAGPEDWARLFGCRLGQSWRLAALDLCPEETLRSHVSLRGQEHFEKAAAEGRGVILVHCHYGAAHAVSVVLNRLGFPHAAVLKFREQARHGRVEHLDLIPLTRNDPVRPLLLARQRLKRGGNVLITGDGPYGERVRVPFLGATGGFPQGFATLALVTGAPMVPVFATPAAGGHLTIDLLPPLATGRPDEPRAARVEAIVREYARLLERRWLADPALVWWMGKELSPPLPWRLSHSRVADAPPVAD